MRNLQEESDLKSTIPISARRFEESPFIERTNTPNMIRGVYAGRYFPMQIDEDPIEKYWLLRQKAVIFDGLNIYPLDKFIGTGIKYFCIGSNYEG